MERELTCINCPVGCRMTVSVSPDGRFESVIGNTCQRGAVYAEQECTQPMRMVTAVIPVEGSKVPLSVKTSAPIAKSMINDIMKVLDRASVSAPVNIGDVILENALGTGVDVIATREIKMVVLSEEENPFI